VCGRNVSDAVFKSYSRVFGQLITLITGVKYGLIYTNIIKLFYAGINKKTNVVVR